MPPNPPLPLPIPQRIVRLGGAVDDDMANLLVAQLLYLDSVDPQRDITMYINSPGGSVTAGVPQGWGRARIGGAVEEAPWGVRRPEVGPGGGS